MAIQPPLPGLILSGEEELLASGGEERWKKCFNGAQGSFLVSGSWRDSLGQKIPKTGALSFLRGLYASLGTLPRVMPCPPPQTQAPTTVRAGPLAARDRVGGWGSGWIGKAERWGRGQPIPGRSCSSDKLDPGDLEGQKTKLGSEFSGPHTPGWEFGSLYSLKQQEGSGRRVVSRRWGEQSRGSEETSKR